MKIKNDPKKHIKRSDLIQGSKLTYREKLKIMGVKNKVDIDNETIINGYSMPKH